jgi:hypothetical protein
MGQSARQQERTKVPVTRFFSNLSSDTTRKVCLIMRFRHEGLERL